MEENLTHSKGDLNTDSNFWETMVQEPRESANQNNLVPKFMRPTPMPNQVYVSTEAIPPRPEGVIEKDASTSCEIPDFSNWEAPKRRKKTTPSKKPSDPRENQTGMSLRQHAQSLKEKHTQLLRKATSERDKGRPASSDQILAVAKELHTQYLSWNAKAEEKLFAEKNGQMDATLTIDLHFLTAAEAEARLAAHLPGLAAAARQSKSRWVRIVVGAGAHSAGGRPVLEPATRRWLDARGIKSRQAAPGVLEAQASDLTVITAL